MSFPTQESPLMRDVQEKKTKGIMIVERGSVNWEGAGSREAQCQVSHQDPYGGPLGPPQPESGATAPGPGGPPSVPRLMQISRLHPDHTIGGAGQAPDADAPGSVCGRLRGARRAAASPQCSERPHQCPGRSAPRRHPNTAPSPPPASGLSHYPDRSRACPSC